MINLYKRIDGKLRFVDYGIPRLMKSYKKRGYVIGGTFLEHKVASKDADYRPIHHIHRARFGLRERVNGLICKLIPKRFLDC